MKSYIDAETFLSLDKEVQKVFTDWWEPEVGDRFYENCNNYERSVIVKLGEDGCFYHYSTNYDQIEMTSKCECEGEYVCIPLLRMDQLIAFIEEKTGFKCILDYSKCGYELLLVSEGIWHKTFEIRCNDKLECYFESAKLIAKQITQD